MKKADGTARGLIDRTQVARVIFSAAESMGISDRKRIEKLTTQVIERLERPQMLPGMEHLAPRNYKQKHATSEFEILSVVKEFLGEYGAEERVEETGEERVERNTKEEPAMADKTRITADIELNQNAIHVLERRYLKKDKQGNIIETPAKMFRRVAQAIASAEVLYDPEVDTRTWEDEFYRLMTGLEFLPNSPTLMNAGKELGQLSACFVLPIEDSMESIFETVKNTALIHKSGGGTGFSFSRLRPESDRVGSTGGVASGPVSFMRAFDVATDVIKQGGTRRGANMAILDVDHPDIEKFIKSKDDMVSLTNFNISVAVTTGFMQAVKSGDDYNLLNPHTREIVGKLNAKEVFDKMVALAWKTGDPGIVFIDRINQDNPTPHLGSIESTNPCGEQPLLPYESCNLGSINLSRMLCGENGGTSIDYKKLAQTVKTAVRFLDNVIDVNKFPLSQIKEMTQSTRKIGLGVMGFADMLINLCIPYNSEKALETAAEIMDFIDGEASKASVALAQERGVFPAFEGSIYDVDGGPRVRNASRTTIAPTGTLSLIAGCSSGIEPLFALSYTRNILDGTRMVEVNPHFEAAARQGGFYSEELLRQLAEGAHLNDMADVSPASKEIFVTAHEIDTRWHVRMQAAFQKYTDNAVSKTINFSRDATPDNIAEAYMMAYDEGLKGITIYRDGSRVGQVLSTGKMEEKKETEATVAKRSPRKRAKKTSGVTEKVNTGCGHLYVTVNSDEQGICEVFSMLGKAGGCASAQLEATCRMISLALRSGIDVDSVVKQLKGIRCPSIAWESGKSTLSCADAIAGVLESHINEIKSESDTENTKIVQDYGLVKNVAGQCPDCGNLLVYQEGCFICPGCGYTKC
ncbi:vitamin B12-dependent ribonucleotide reductase [Chloroflexota bacterium]